MHNCLSFPFYMFCFLCQLRVALLSSIYHSKLAWYQVVNSKRSPTSHKHGVKLPFVYSPKLQDAFLVRFQRYTLSPANELCQMFLKNNKKEKKKSSANGTLHYWCNFVLNYWVFFVWLCKDWESGAFNLNMHTFVFITVWWNMRHIYFFLVSLSSFFFCSFWHMHQLCVAFCCFQVKSWKNYLSHTQRVAVSV